MTRRRSFAIALGLAVGSLLLVPRAARAHVGSPVVVEETDAGPYHLLVTIRPPDVVPGRASVDVQVLGTPALPDVRRVTIVPLPLAGPGVRSSPVPDEATPDPADPGVYHGLIWLMRMGSWQVRVSVEGAAGVGAAGVPVQAFASRVRDMPVPLGVLLLGLLGLLVAGIVGIAGAGARDADLAPGEPAGPRRVRRARVAMAIATAGIAAAFAGGRSWWRTEDQQSRRAVYRPLGAGVTVARDRILRLTLEEPGWLRFRKLDDLLPDHGHLMHLFLVRTPGDDVVAHLHPDAVAPGRFEQKLPALPPGRYRLFGDIVHRTGMDETVTATVDLPADADAAAPVGDDAVGTIARAATAAAPRFAFPDGTGALRWIDPAPLTAGRAAVLAFALEDPDGRPLPALEPYMGMAGHAMFLAADGSVFAHVHPTGSVPMATLALAEDPAAPPPPPGAAAPDPHAAHRMHAAAALPPRVSFPYAFPRPGAYRLFIQVKVAGHVETAAFDVHVE